MTVNVQFHCLVTSPLVSWVGAVFPQHVMKSADLPMLIDHLLMSFPFLCSCCRDSSVSTATRYGLDGPGIKSRWGRYFLHLSRPVLGPTQPPTQWLPGNLVKATGAWRWPHIPNLVPRMWKQCGNFEFYEMWGISWEAEEGSIGFLTRWGRVTQICVFTIQLCKTDDANLRLFSLHNTLNYAIHRACLRMVLLTDVYRNLTSLWINF